MSKLKLEMEELQKQEDEWKQKEEELKKKEKVCWEWFTLCTVQLSMNYVWWHVWVYYNY